MPQISFRICVSVSYLCSDSYVCVRVIVLYLGLFAQLSADVFVCYVTQCDGHCQGPCFLSADFSYHSDSLAALHLRLLAFLFPPLRELLTFVIPLLALGCDYHTMARTPCSLK